MPTSRLKRTSGGLRRLLASLRPPAAPLPVQTGFPTSLADIVVKNHGRLRNPRRRPRAAPSPAATAAPQRRELSVANDAPAAAAAAGSLVPTGPGKGAGFSIRPGLLVAGGAVVLVLLVIWSKRLVAVATLASVALSWIEYVRTVVRPRRPESPRPSCGSGEDDLGCDDTSSQVMNMNPKLKQRRRSLRKLVASKLRNGKRRTRGTDSFHGGDAGELPETPRRLNAEPGAAAAAAPRAEETPTPRRPEAIINDDRWHRRCGSTLPLPALVPIILAGLVAGKLPALALAVLCVAFSSPVERVPAAAGQEASR